jgi:uncharacterized protein YndB with AHSA1/START domain
MTGTGNVLVHVTHRFTASPEQVFDAWVDPQVIGRWMFGPTVRDEEIVRLSTDPRVGGRFSFLVRRQGEEIDHVGEYFHFERPRRLGFTWGVPKYSPDSARVIVDIAALANGCELTLTHELTPNWAEFASRTKDGWRKMLDTLATALG